MPQDPSEIQSVDTQGNVTYTSTTTLSVLTDAVAKAQATVDDLNQRLSSAQDQVSSLQESANSAQAVLANAQALLAAAQTLAEKDTPAQS